MTIKCLLTTLLWLLGRIVGLVLQLSAQLFLLVGVYHASYRIAEFLPASLVSHACIVPEEIIKSTNSFFFPCYELLITMYNGMSVYQRIPPFLFHLYTSSYPFCERVLLHVRWNTMALVLPLAALLVWYYFFMKAVFYCKAQFGYGAIACTVLLSLHHFSFTFGVVCLGLLVLSVRPGLFSLYVATMYDN